MAGDDRHFDASDAGGRVPVVDRPPSTDGSTPGQARWVQLTYSSFDQGSGAAGGWQIKQTTGEPSAAEREVLRSLIQTRLDSGVPVPSFPTQDEIDRLPRRLVYRPLKDGAAGYWHTVPAGLDGSGRPGNIFCHAVLDRMPATAAPATRPIDTWRSPGWLTPFGPQQVLAAELVGVDPPVAGPLDRRAVLAFLHDRQHWRLGVLGPLLDAVANALSGGPGVLLAVGSAETAALWIAAVSHLMSAGTSRRWGFSTMESLRGGTGDHGNWPALAIVDRAELTAEAPWSALVRIDEDEIVEIGDLDGAAHLTRAGSAIPVTAWSVLAQVVVEERASTAAVLDAMDEIAATVGDTDLWISWPMALALTRFPSVLQRVEAAAAAVVAEHSPNGLRAHPAEFGAAVEMVTRTVGTGAAGAWLAVQRCERADRGSVMVDIVSAIYLDRALADRDWVLARPEIPLPATVTNGPSRAAPALVSSAGEAVTALRRRVVDGADLAAPGVEQVDDALYALRLIDALVRLRLDSAGDPTDRRLQDDLYLIVELTVIPVLLDNRCSAELLARTGGSCRTGVAGYLTTELLHRLEHRERDLGDRVPPAVLGWLHPQLPAAPALDALAAGSDGDLLTAEIAVQIALGRLPAAESVRRAWTPIAWWFLLAEGQLRQQWPPVTEALAAAVSRSGPWSVAALDAVDRHFPGNLPLSVTGDALWSEPPTAELSRLATRYSARQLPPGRRHPGGQYTAGDVWTLRSTADTTWWARQGPGTSGNDPHAAIEAAWLIARVAKRIAGDARAPVFPAGTAGAVLAATCLLGLTDRRANAALGLTAMLGWFASTLESVDFDHGVAVLDHCIDQRAVSDSQVWHAALKGDPGLPAPWQATAVQRGLAAVTGRDQRSLLAALAQKRLARKAIADTAGLLDGIGDQAWRELRRTTEHIDDEDRLMSDWEKFAKAWYRRMRSDSTPGVFSSRTLFRRGQRDRPSVS